MSRSWLIILLAIDLYCLVLLWCSLWPGRLEDWVFVAAILSMGLLLVVIPIGSVVVLLRRRHQRSVNLLDHAPFSTQRRRQYPLRRVAIATAMMVLVTQISLTFNWPMRGAFALSEGAFLAQVDNAPMTDDSFSEFPLNQRLGLYYVTYYATDSRGGTYFQTGAHGFFPAPHGFAFQPNDQGSPFGNDVYHIEPIHKDWYWFRASWDW
ncbi:MAG: hypothetical protein F6K00_12140 [Leptolyngbya sp. SIOISBB]|nr:hypothetical protein [Leptolyngbya sp. SIOISBB]